MIMEMYTILAQCTLCCFSLIFLIIVGISSVYFYFHWYLKGTNINITNVNANTETVIN